MSALAVDVLSPRNRSEGPQSALHVEMCMAQHLSLRGFLAFTAIGANVLTSLIPPLAQKIAIVFPPPNISL